MGRHYGFDFHVFIDHLYIYEELSNQTVCLLEGKKHLRQCCCSRKSENNALEISFH